MHQLEIKFFWPLTEQIPLDLDYSRCDNYESSKMLTTVPKGVTTISIPQDLTTWTTTSTISINPQYERVGTIQVSPDFHIHVKKKPSWLARFAMEKIFDWKWSDK